MGKGHIPQVKTVSDPIQPSRQLCASSPFIRRITPPTEFPNRRPSISYCWRPACSRPIRILVSAHWGCGSFCAKILHSILVSLVFCIYFGSPISLFYDNSWTTSKQISLVRKAKLYIFQVGILCRLHDGVALLADGYGTTIHSIWSQPYGLPQHIFSRESQARLRLPTRTKPRPHLHH